MIRYYPPASLGRRLAAALVDTLIAALPLMATVALILAPLIKIVAGLEPLWADQFITETVIILYTALPLSFCWFCYYLLLRDSFGRGQSWGKKICGLMVMDLANHQPCDRKGSFGRNYLGFSLALFGLVLPALALIEPLCIILSEQGLRTGDRWAGTQVINYQDRNYYSAP